MPRSSKPNVSVVERIRWLNELERGKGITEISKAAGRDIRIVKRHIEAAREERVWAQARAEFLRSRLERHQEDILDQVQECRAICARPDPTAITGFDLNRRNRPRMYQALQEHLSRLDVKQQWNSFVRVIDEYLEARKQFQREVTKEEHRLLESLPEIGVHPWHDHISDMVESESWKSKSFRRAYSAPQPSKGLEDSLAFHLSYGEFSLLKSGVDYPVIESVQRAHESLVAIAEDLSERLATPIEALNNLAPEISYQLETILLKRMVPGRCELCP